MNWEAIGAIGEVLSVDFHWMLNTHHGADYFRRWHSQKRFSGGLMVHKATHHFDLVNWWLSAVPTAVFAKGDRKFYTPETADRYGLRNRGDRVVDVFEQVCRGLVGKLYAVIVDVGAIMSAVWIGVLWGGTI